MGQLPPLRVSRDDGNFQLPPPGLAPQDVEIQLAGEKMQVPWQDERNTASVQPTEPMPDGSEVVLGLQFYD
jgi:hypothetical protein